MLNILGKRIFISGESSDRMIPSVISCRSVERLDRPNTAASLLREARTDEMNHDADLTIESDIRYVIR